MMTLAIINLDAFGQRRGAETCYASLLQTFVVANFLEAQFWEIGRQIGESKTRGKGA